MRGIQLAVSAFLISVPNLLVASSHEKNVVTLYRNSAFDSTMRIHVATFDATTNPRSYNSENCGIAAKLFQEQPGVSVRYWCEPGRYKREWE